MRVYWTYEEDSVVLDENITDRERQNLLKGKMWKERKRYLQQHKVTKDKLVKEKQQLIDIYPDYSVNLIMIHLQKPIHYIRTRIQELKHEGLLREEPVLIEQQKDYIKFHSQKKKTQVIAKDLDLSINLVKMVISEEYRNQEKNIENNKPDKTPRKMKLSDRGRPPDALDKRKIRQKAYKDNALYEVELKSDLRKNESNIFKGNLIYQNGEFIVLKHKLGYKESFQKVDFETGQKTIREVIK